MKLKYLIVLVLLISICSCSSQKEVTTKYIDDTNTQIKFTDKGVIITNY